MAQRKKVLHIIKSLGRGGAEMLLPETLACHDQEKFEFHYIYFLPWKNQMVSALEKAGGRVVCFSASNNAKIILQCRNVIRYIKNNNIELIHAHLPWAGFLSRLIHRFTGIAVLYTEHNKQERYHRLTFLINKFTFNWQSRALAVSDDVKQSIVKNIKPSIPVQTLLNGVNTETFQRNSEAGMATRKFNGIPEHALVVGTVAVFRFQKRLIEWLEVMKVVCDQDENFYGILVGDGPLMAEVLDKRKELNLESRIIMPGLITDVKPWISAMDIYMMSSVFEGLPIALLEAMSMECAVVTTNAGGIKEVIRHEQEGLVVDVDDWKQLSDSIMKLKDNQTRSSFARNARARVTTSFSVKQMVKELESLYVAPANK